MQEKDIPRRDEKPLTEYSLCRPFVPSDDVSYFELQKQVHELETMPQTAIRPPRYKNKHPFTLSAFSSLSLSRFNADEFLAIEDLPAPKKAAPKPEPELERPKPAVMRQVGIADQIAIRSYVLGKGAKSSKSWKWAVCSRSTHDDFILSTMTFNETKKFAELKITEQC